MATIAGETMYPSTSARRLVCTIMASRFPERRRSRIHLRAAATGAAL
jgi:hypothetical protein